MRVSYTENSKFHLSENSYFEFLLFFTPSFLVNFFLNFRIGFILLLLPSFNFHNLSVLYLE